MTGKRLVSLLLSVLMIISLNFNVFASDVSSPQPDTASIAAEEEASTSAGKEEAEEASTSAKKEEAEEASTSAGKEKATEAAQEAATESDESGQKDVSAQESKQSKEYQSSKERTLKDADTGVTVTLNESDIDASISLDDVVLKVTKMSEADAKALIAQDSKDYKVSGYDISLQDGSENEIQPKNAVKLTIPIPDDFGDELFVLHK